MTKYYIAILIRDGKTRKSFSRHYTSVIFSPISFKIRSLSLSPESINERDRCQVELSSGVRGEGLAARVRDLESDGIRARH